MYVSDFYSVVSPSGETCFYAKLWLLVYDNGLFFSWNEFEVRENYELMLETGVNGIFTYSWVFISKSTLPDVFNSCSRRQSEPALYEESV